MIVELVVRYGEDVYVLSEVEASVKGDDTNTVWDGSLLLISYTTIMDHQTFKSIIDVMLRQGFSSRVVGSRNLCILKGVYIRARLTEAERAEYGDEACAVVRIDYRTMRDYTAGSVIEEPGGVFAVSLAGYPQR